MPLELYAARGIGAPLEVKHQSSHGLAEHHRLFESLKALCANRENIASEGHRRNAKAPRLIGVGRLNAGVAGHQQQLGFHHRLPRRGDDRPLHLADGGPLRKGIVGEQLDHQQRDLVGRISRSTRKGQAATSYVAIRIDKPTWTASREIPTRLTASPEDGNVSTIRTLRFVSWEMLSRT